MSDTDPGPGPSPLSREPKLALDELLVQLIDRAQDVVAVQGRLRSLLRANKAVAGHLSLPELLSEIVGAARTLTQARYGAIGVIGPGGVLQQFIHVGMDPATADRIGHLPEGRGLLGALIADPWPIRLVTMADDPRSVGFPANHPPMDGFLGVPVRVRDIVFGNLYLTSPAAGAFTTEDEELVSAFAATAGVAIDNARLYDEAQRRQEWLQASTEVTRQLLSVDGEDPLQVIARMARRLSDADVVTVLLPTGDGQLSIEVASGHGEAELVARTSPRRNGVVADALDSGVPVLVGRTADDEPFAALVQDVISVGPVMVLPLGSPPDVRGALVVGRAHGRPPFGDADLEMAATFADHAAVALELADARADQQRIVMLEDHDRIAADLHDHVIQRLFAIGLTVQSVAASMEDRPRAARLERAVLDVDETIVQTRTSIYQLRGPLGPEIGTVRRRLVLVAGQVGPVLGFEARVTFAGPVDAVVPEPIVDDLVAVLRETLSNTARHAHATRADVAVLASTTQVSLTISDDGVGMGDVQRRSGLANLARRAERLGGAMTLTAGPENEGTCVRWTIPLT